MAPKKLGFIIFIVAVLLSLMGCTTLSKGIPITGGDQLSGIDAALANTRWRLVSYGKPGSESPVVEGTEVTLQFEDGSQAKGSGGCNTFGAEYDISSNGQEISITHVVPTMMECHEDNFMEQEVQYFTALQSADRFELIGDSLTIGYGSGEGVLHFLKIKTTPPNTVNI